MAGSNKQILHHRSTFFFPSFSLDVVTKSIVAAQDKRSLSYFSHQLDRQHHHHHTSDPRNPGSGFVVSRPWRMMMMMIMIDT